MPITFERLRAGTSAADADSGSEVARKFNDNFTKIKSALDEVGPSSSVQIFEPQDESAMLALDAHKGDFAIRPDGVFLLKREPPSSPGNWISLTASSDSGGAAGQRNVSFAASQWTRSGNVWTFSTASSQYPSGVWKAADAGYMSVLCDMSMNASTHTLTISAPQAFDGILVFAAAGSGTMNPQAKTVRPSAAEQVVLPDDEYDCLSQVTVTSVPYEETPNDFGGRTVTIL